MRRSWLLVFLVACGGPSASAPPPVSNQPPPPPKVAEPAPSPKPAKPSCSDEDPKCLVQQMEYYSNSMCACADKACAESVNTALTEWAQNLAKNPNLANQKPDPALAKKSADIMTKYTECMTKLYMADAGQGGTPPVPADPCGGDPCGGP